MILITGASGFLGQHLTRFLAAKGLPVRALYLNTPPSQEMKDLSVVEWVKCDLLDIFAVEEAMVGIEEVYHCAAMVSFDPKDRAEMLHFNKEAAANIVNQAVLQGIRKMVHVSSVAAIGRSGESQKEITEEEEWGESKYNSAYGLSKYMAETEVWRGIGEGLNAAIVNPGIILGAGDWDSGSANLIKVVAKGFPFYTTGVNSWVDVQDVVGAMYLLMGCEITAERYILSAGSFTYKEVFGLMANGLKIKPPSIHANKLMTGVAWRYASVKSKFNGKKPLITKETAETARGTSIYNNTKFLKAFPTFAYTGIGQTISNMAQCYLESNIV